MRIRFSTTFLALFLAGLSPAFANILDITGPGLGDKDINADATLWSLVGVGSGLVLPGDKNADLRYYVIAYNTGGARSVFSLGELDPGFGGPHGGSTLTPYVTVTGGSLALVDPLANAAGRGLSDLTALQVVGLSQNFGPGGISSTLTVSGATARAGVYTDLSAFSDKTLPTSGPSVTYKGTQFFSFLSPTNSNSLNQIVTTIGSDGYTVVYSLAELDPAFGGDPNILLATSQTTGTFPGIARTILPGDNKHGRWESNLVSIDVRDVPLHPSTWPMMILGCAAFGFIAYRRKSKPALMAV